ncbi:hypothetical protein BCR34DRAFT_227227 [Clohesyomyces aquaticus]|uniref:Uncharacterized protein n=1 Tax=Clohesyomyces aquaticus TaxID=1231657 RepID=A0A1Y1Y7S4_9PLEO|nr:hypothetical protein BCR34DRAFT_227227 [Clohesyomyces aquaticus]
MCNRYANQTRSGERAPGQASTTGNDVSKYGSMHAGNGVVLPGSNRPCCWSSYMIPKSMRRSKQKFVQMPILFTLLSRVGTNGESGRHFLSFQSPGVRSFHISAGSSARSPVYSGTSVFHVPSPREHVSLQALKMLGLRHRTSTLPIRSCFSLPSLLFLESSQSSSIRGVSVFPNAVSVKQSFLHQNISFCQKKSISTSVLVVIKTARDMFLFFQPSFRLRQEEEFLFHFPSLFLFATLN